MNDEPLKEEYKEYTLGLALFDAIPVIVFLMSSIIIYTMYGSLVFLTGAAACFIGGMSKVIWKILVVKQKKDHAALTKVFRIFMFGGFGLMILSVLLRIGQGSLAGLWHSLTMMPATVFFVLGCAGMVLMGYLGSHMDYGAKANWIEESVNTIAQTAILIGVIIVYFGTFYHGTDTAIAALDGTADVKVSEEEEYYLFDGPGSDNALVFYQGAKVAPEAYAPLMLNLAEEGTDCFLCRMPNNFAFFGKNMANDIRREHENDRYRNWYLAGHSLGGVAASMLTSEEMTWDGIVFLASYPTGELEIPALSIYGSNDKVLNLESYEEAGNKGLWPDDFTELIIEGGNHAGFGSYGEQKGDGTPSITEQKQQTETAAQVTEWINAHR